jgi:hypothetical protein
MVLHAASPSPQAGQDTEHTEDEHTEEDEEEDEEDSQDYLTFLRGVRKSADQRYANAKLRDLVDLWYPAYWTITAWPGAAFKEQFANRETVAKCGQGIEAECAHAARLLATVEPSKYSLSGPQLDRKFMQLLARKAAEEDEASE